MYPASCTFYLIQLDISNLSTTQQLPKIVESKTFSTFIKVLFNNMSIINFQIWKKATGNHDTHLASCNTFLFNNYTCIVYQRHASYRILSNLRLFIFFMNLRLFLRILKWLFDNHVYTLLQISCFGKGNQKPLHLFFYIWILRWYCKVESGCCLDQW